MAHDLDKQRRVIAFSGIFSAVLFTAILIVVNLIAAQHDFQQDLTSNKRFTLSEQTHKILDNLEQPVMAFCFLRESDQDYETIKNLLFQYRTASRNFEFRFVDLDREPILANKYGVTSYQTTVLEQGEKFRKIVESTEHAFTNTLLRLTKGDIQKKIYFTRGNGELDIESIESNGLAFLKMALNDVNYITQSINLMTVKTIPDDCAVLAIVGPSNDLTVETQEILEQYMQNGGRLFIALEPSSGSTYRELLTSFGIEAGTGIVLDPNGFQNILQPIVENFQTHEITATFEYGLVFHVASTMSASKKETPGWISADLGLTTEETWIEPDIESFKGDEPVFDPEKNEKKSLSILATAQSLAAEDDAAIARVVAIGDADFTSNIFFQTFAAHQPFIMNAFHWLADEKDLIAIPPKEHLSQPLLLQDTQFMIGFAIPVIILPLIIALLGIVRIISRRRNA